MTMSDSKGRWVVKVDRSRIELYQRCPRARWWANHYGGKGLQSTRLSLPLLTGSATHEGLRLLLCHPEKGEEALEAGIIHARAFYDAEVRKSQIDLEQSEDQYYVAQEQMALAEALIRAFAMTELPRLLDQYEIVDVEREEEAPLVQTSTLDLRLMGRVDVVVRERDSGDLNVWSFKTTATWDRRKDRNAETDIQGLSEGWLVEQRTGDKVQGVQMIHLVKGRRSEHPKGSGRWITFNPLIRGYRRHATVGTEFAHSWEWENEDGTSGRLGGKWERFDVWTDFSGGVKGWMDAIAAGQIQPLAPSPIPQHVITPPPYFRSPEDQANWLQQTRAQEVRVADAVGELESDPIFPEYDILLNTHFPMYRHTCHYPSDCTFLRLCYGSDDYRRDPIGTGDFKEREPNHPQEVES